MLGALTLSALAPAGSAAAAPASPAHKAPSSGLQKEFAAAADEFHVPVSVLMGVSYQESQWEGHKGEYNTEGGYGVMNLTDVTPSMIAKGGAGAVGRHDLMDSTTSPALHTLTAAAKLTGASAAQLRTDERQNIRGGAALLASYERAVTGGTPTDPGHWYGAVAKYSQYSDKSAAKNFADHVFSAMSQGAGRRTAAGQQLQLNAEPTVKPDSGQLGKLGLRQTAKAPTECPHGVKCTFDPVDPKAGNHQVANGPDGRGGIRYIVIHDIEGSYEGAIKDFKAPDATTSAHYVMQSATGDVTQMVPTKDVSFHAGNYWFNMHSVGIEHEGFAAEGAKWYTGKQYQATADLVKYLSKKNHIPLDRQHLIGHDNVPGPNRVGVKDTHWDPGPYWDWDRFMQMVGKGSPKSTGRAPAVGSAITIAPNFARNKQTVQVCNSPSGAPKPCTSQTEPSNFLYVHTAPNKKAPLFGDPALHPDGSAGTNHIDDWGNTVQAGQQFVVADARPGWTAIWFSGSKVWFPNPIGMNTKPAKGATILTAKKGTKSAPVYGMAYPQPSEYPQGFSPDPFEALSMYGVPAGQAYVANAAPVHADDFFKVTAQRPESKVVTGSKTYYTIQYNHRVALLDSADTRVVPHGGGHGTKPSHGGGGQPAADTSSMQRSANAAQAQPISDVVPTGGGLADAAPAADVTGKLASTGSDPLSPWAVAGSVAALAGGTGLVWATRRRSRWGAQS
ncbi:N-acetylmuramoyl-L-alanine amidase [Streptomyces kronopolitis]|uniref:N-acetylmuramoyl-L-alanine amidase n=1 Tax=Streptomyces kronopolitis TaxID=1612435 RepID=UPI003449A142